MRFFEEAAWRLEAVSKLRALLEKKISPVSLSGVSQVQKAQVLLALSKDAPILAVTPDDASARLLCEDINFMAGERVSYPYPGKELNFYSEAGISREYEQMRLSALWALCAGRCRVLAASAEAVTQFTIPEQTLRGKTLRLTRGEEYDMGEIAGKLAAMGYLRCEQVDAPGQFSVRGAILDIFSPCEEMPARAEFWGDTLENLAWFEPQTQRREGSLESMDAVPAAEALPDAESLCAALSSLSGEVSGPYEQRWKEKLAADCALLREGVALKDIDLYFPLIYSPPAAIFDYPFSAVFLCETAACEEAFEGLSERVNEDVRLGLEQGTLCAELSHYVLSRAEVFERIGKLPLVCANTFFAGSETFDYREKLEVQTAPSEPWNGSTRILAERLKELSAAKARVMVCAGTAKTLPILERDLRESGISCAVADADSESEEGAALLMQGGLSGGFSYPSTGYVCIAQAKARPVSKSRRRFQSGSEIRALSEISEGDLVVHAEHGIGRFMGIHKMELEGVSKDYITIQYAGTDVLYVPVTQLDRVSRYIGGRDDSEVRLSRLTSKEWQKTRSNVKKAVKDMAGELLTLYAARERSQGFAFEPDDEIQRDFEARFPYVETSDQLRCTEEIKADMERDRPMDRLLCGDVGFGKTEVAFRAAMKCMLSGKQCVMLAPTTVLANQHYETATRRFESVPVTIELLSRFRTKRQQEQILEKIAAGKVDFVIGTHRLLSNDVKFRNLGLAIVDEEQRFGVAHKEKFKEMFHGVDMLTLSATPIPRTLNMALSGIRDMSVIDEPPQDRYPVQSYVLEYSEGLITQAITRELKRGGQVYYLHNRVETIAQCAARVQKLHPGARVAFAHGRMGEQELGEVWRQLLDGEIDILVCTTIIETGVDVPNVNTLVIEQADRFGLAQLYQLRGRVGRGSRRAYAYFTYRANKSLSEVAQKRLDAMREFTQFGSGFRIAMRDLEIRGAGSVLGARQHGQMEQVGYDMYLKLLNEAIAEEKGEAPKEAPDCVMELPVEAHIPRDYIESTPARLEIYRRIALVRTEEDRADLTEELKDRFGEPPASLANLMDVSLARNFAASLGISGISQRDGALRFTLLDPAPKQLSAILARYFDRFYFNDKQSPGYVAVRLKPGEQPMALVREFLELYRENAG